MMSSEPFAIFPWRTSSRNPASAWRSGFFRCSPVNALMPSSRRESVGSYFTSFRAHHASVISVWRRTLSPFACSGELKRR